MDLGVIPNTEDLDVVNILTLEESEEEYSNNNALEDNEILYFSVIGPKLIKRIVLYLAQRFEEIFPKVQGKRRINPNEFD